MLLDARIVRGNEASLGQFPYQVTLALQSGNLLCGGSLVTSILVMTAAHCVHGKSSENIRVISGNHKLNTVDDHEQVVNVNRIEVHEGYRFQDYRNDIAIIFLSTEITLNMYANTIVLPTEDTKFENSAIVSGWGHEFNGGSITNTLQWTTVEIIPKQDCRQLYLPQRKVIAGEVLCALGQQGEDTCQFDSGGPLACKGLDGKTYLCGIVSWGKECGTLPGVYTNVAKFSEWIKSKIDPVAMKDIYGGRETPTPSAIIPHSIGSPNPLESLPFRCRSVGTFQCAVSKKCFPNEYKCNGKFDCGPDDHTDETDCPQRSSDWRNSAETMSAEYFCDNKEFYCSSSDQCIHKTYLCDGTVECPDISLDEVECDHDGRMEITQENPCAENYFYCVSSNLCFPNEDYSYDEVCSESTDELGRTGVEGLGPCHDGDFHCEQSNLCISNTLRCNGDMDCDLGEDEAGCGADDDIGISDDITALQEDSKHCDSDDWECIVGWSPRQAETDGRTGESPCDENFFYCAISNLCIPIRNRCNGQYDCEDGDYSDEEDCPDYVDGRSIHSAQDTSVDSAFCNAGDFLCDNSGFCISKTLRCNGNYDCGYGDTTDEDGCDVRSANNELEDSWCDEDHFYCDILSECLSHGHHCTVLRV